MKKKILAITFLVVALLTMTVVMFGCGTNGEKEVYEYTIELGEEYTFNAGDVFGVGIKDAELYDADLSTLDVNKAGTYDVNVKFQDKTYIVRYTVADTKPPMITLKEDYVFTNDVTNIDCSAFAEYTDANECKEEVTRFEKIDALKVLKDADIKAYTDSIIFTSTEELLNRENTSVTEDGIYKAIYSVTDAAGNVNAREVIVILDTTKPRIEGVEEIDDVIKVENPNDTWTETFVSELHTSDNVDGTVFPSQLQVIMTLTDKENYTYTVNVSYVDRAGNKAAVEYSFSLVGETEEPTPTESEKPTETEIPTESQKPDDGNGNVNVEPTEPQYTYTDLNKTMYVSSSVNVRDLPTSDGKKLGSLSEGAEVKVTGQCNETKWYRIEFDGKTAYVSNKYLTTEKPKEEETEEYLPSGYSWQDRDGDGLADLPDSVNINGWNVRMKNTTPEGALFKKELAEAGLYEVRIFNTPDGRLQYNVLAPTSKEAFTYLKNWLNERGLDFGDASAGNFDTEGKVKRLHTVDVFEYISED